MGNFIFETTPIDGMMVISPKVFGDDRGYFMETYKYNDFAEVGLNMQFVQDNQSKSKKGVLRGLHYQTKNPQGKLVRVVQGEVFDVGVDLRPKSKTLGKWFGLCLTAENKKQFYIPEGFAHGFLVLSNEAEFVYKCTCAYDPLGESGLRWDDPTIGVQWPVERIDEVFLSEKDKIQPFFSEYLKNTAKE